MKSSFARSVLVASVGLCISAHATAGSTGGGRFGHDAWIRAVEEAGLDSGTVVYPFTASTAMVEWAEQAAEAGGSRGELQRLVRVQEAMFEDGAFNFAYDSQQTLTAQEAFDSQSGNCISFTVLFVALTRSVGVPTRLMSVEGTPRVRRDGGLVIINRHVVAAFESGNDVAIFDFSLTSEDELIGRRIIDDVEASAMFHNNLGAAALRRGDAAGARDHLELTTVLWPDWVVGWINLGVTVARLGHPDQAIEANRRALELDFGNPSALNNMAHVYLALGRTQEARAARLAAAETTESPYLLVTLAYSEMDLENWQEAERYLKRAKRNYSRVPEVYEGLARLAEETGRAKRMERYLRKAERYRTP